MNTNNDKVLVSSSIFIVTFMMLDTIISGKSDMVPRQAMLGLILITMLSSLDVIGLHRISGPFSALIAGTVFLTRGERIFNSLNELSKGSAGITSGGATF